MKFSTDRHCPTLIGFTLQGKARIIYCGQWSCPRCSKKLARKWANRVRIHITETTRIDGENWYMLTVTLGSTEKEVAPAYRKLKKLWNRLRMSITRQVKTRWQYCAFVEGQPKRQSMPHFHIILNVIPPKIVGKKGRVTKHAVHNFAHRLGWGFEADFQAVTDDDASYYVSKYVSKGSAVIPRGFRRVRVSRRWTPFPLDPLKRLIVRRQGETLPDFFTRVQELTDTPLDDLYSEWSTATYELGELQSHAR